MKHTVSAHLRAISLVLLMFFGVHAYGGCNAPNEGTLCSDGTFHFIITSSYNPYTCDVCTSTNSQSASTCGDAVYALPKYSGNLTIPSTAYASGMWSYSGPYTTTGIAANTFKDCTGLISVVVPNTVATVGNNAFDGCMYLQQVEFGTGVLTLGSEVFKNCYSLQTVTFKGNVPYGLSSSLFEQCVNLSAIYVPCDKLSLYQRALGSSMPLIGFTPYTYTISSANPNQGTVLESAYDCATNSFTVHAIPNNGYQFANWSDGNTDNPRTIVLTQDINLTAIFERIPNPNAHVIDFAQVATTINDWTVLNATINPDNTDVSLGKYVYDIYGGVAAEVFMATEPDVVFQVRNSSDKAKAFVVYPGMCFEFGGKNGILVFRNTNYGDTIKITVAAKGSSVASFADDYGSYPINATAVSTDLTLPTKGSAGGDERGYVWRELVFVSAGGDVQLKEFSGGYRIKRIEIIPAGNPRIYNIDVTADPSKGSVSVQRTGVNMVTLTAVPNTGYRFTSWSDGNTDNPRSITLTQDLALTAIFVANINPNQPQIWPIIMDDVTFGYVQDQVVADFRPDEVDSHLWIWENTYDSTDVTGLNFYGKTEGYLSLQVTNYGWSGAGIHLTNDGTTRQEAEYLQQAIVNNPNDYYLHMAIKSTDNYSHCFYLFNGQYQQAKFSLGSNSVYDGPLYSNFTRDGKWHEFYIPMSLFANELAYQPFTENAYIFAMLTEGVQGAKLQLDAVYFCNAASKRQGIEPWHKVSAKASPAEAGSVSVSYSEDHRSATLTANAYYKWKFKQWADGVRDNQRTIRLTQDTSFVAYFVHEDVQVIYVDGNGRVLGYETVPYGGNATAAGINPDDFNFGYSFAGWDHDLNNLTEDITVRATYVRDAVNGLYFIFNREDQTVILDHEGNSYAGLVTLDVPNTIIYRGIRFAVVAIGAYAFQGCDRLTDLVVPSNVEYIYESAFSGCSDLIHVTFSANLRSIADYAFNGCKRIEDITVYATRVPDMTATSFQAVGDKKYINVYVPDDRVNQYKRDEYWSEFNIVVKSAETVDGRINDVTVQPDDNSAQFTWPTETQANSYTIVITKDGVVFCTLIFNANGQLTGIAFAPGRNERNAPCATLLSDGGMQFTVTGLDAGTRYGYSVTTKDRREMVLAEFEGNFKTTGSLEAIDQITNDQSPITSKVIRDGHLFILRGDKTYTITGQVVK